MAGPVMVRTKNHTPLPAWQVEAGNAALHAAARWVAGSYTGVWGEDAPDQVVWVDGYRPARVGDWIVNSQGGPLILSPEAFAHLYEIVDGAVTP